jgi:hypothetical protein
MEAIVQAQEVAAIWFTIVFGVALLAPLFKLTRKGK